MIVINSQLWRINQICSVRTPEAAMKATTINSSVCWEIKTVLLVSRDEERTLILQKIQLYFPSRKPFKKHDFWSLNPCSSFNIQVLTFL